MSGRERGYRCGRERERGYRCGGRETHTQEWEREKKSEDTGVREGETGVREKERDRGGRER